MSLNCRGNDSINDSIPAMITAVEYADVIHTNDRYSGKIPVLLKSGDIELVRWGVYSHYQPEDLPRGPDVGLGRVRTGEWKHRNQRAVQIPAVRYRLSKPGQPDEWFEVPVGKIIQGVAMDLLDSGQTKPVVFVVTVTADPHANLNFHRVPRLVRKHHLDREC